MNIHKEYILSVYIITLCNAILFSRYDMSWIPSYSMWEDCQPYVPGARIFVDITLGSERLMTSGSVLMTVSSTELTLCRNTMSI